WSADVCASDLVCVRVCVCVCVCVGGCMCMVCVSEYVQVCVHAYESVHMCLFVSVSLFMWLWCVVVGVWVWWGGCVWGRGFSYFLRLEKSITIPVAHDAADATRCSRRERRCTCKVTQ